MACIYSNCCHSHSGAHIWLAFKDIWVKFYSITANFISRSIANSTSHHKQAHISWINGLTGFHTCYVVDRSGVLCSRHKDLHAQSKWLTVSHTLSLNCHYIIHLMLVLWIQLNNPASPGRSPGMALVPIWRCSLVDSPASYF